MAIVTIVTGGNQGDRFELLTEARSLIQQRVGDVLVYSAFFESSPWGFVSDNFFLNQAMVISTKLSPYQVLEITQAIEKELGRLSKSVGEGYADRPVDIDIIFYDQKIINDFPRLVIPHPHMHKRRFMLEPLCEIASSLKHPVKKVSLEALRSACVDQSQVVMAEEL
jgi:2-amino-4-hydroxy-6-hydroxymethyldihydropteridine diphosphokinase